MSRAAFEMLACAAPRQARQIDSKRRRTYSFAMGGRIIDISEYSRRICIAELALAISIYVYPFVLAERGLVDPVAWADIFGDSFGEGLITTIIAMPIAYYVIVFFANWAGHRLSRRWVWVTHAVAQWIILVTGLLLLPFALTETIREMIGWRSSAVGAIAVVASATCLGALYWCRGAARAIASEVSAIGPDRPRRARAAGVARYMVLSAASLVLFALAWTLIGFVRIESIGLVGSIAGGDAFAAWFTANVPETARTMADFAWSFVELLLAIALATFALKLILKYERKLAPKARLEDSYLLLRSFADDPAAVRSRNPFVWFRPMRKVRLEEVIAGALVGLGRLIAIGQPGERLPKLGAERFYLADRDWQEFARDAMKQSTAVAMVAGLSTWIRWELGELAADGLVGKLAVFLPPAAEVELHQRWMAVADALDGTPWGPAASGLDSVRLIAAVFVPDGTVIKICAQRRAVIDYDLGARLATTILRRASWSNAARSSE